MKKNIKPTELVDNAISLISKDWMLITAGTPEKFNSMTASWGGVGFLWNKPVVYVFIRPERYTFEFVEKYDNLTLNILGNEYNKAKMLLGSKSGRDGDKIAESGLTPIFTELGTPAFQESRITIECKKLYATPITEDSFIDKACLKEWYGGKHGGLHKMYICEILNIWIED